MVFPWMFEDFAELRQIGEAAELVAASTDWTPLYDPARLQQNTLPVVAVSYFEVGGSILGSIFLGGGMGSGAA